MSENNNLPSGWAWSSIGDVTSPVDKVFPQLNPDEKFKYLDISSIDNKLHKIVEPKEYTGRDAPSRARQLIQKDDVLFSTVRTYLENIAQVPTEFNGQIASTGFAVLRAKSIVHPKFLFYYCLSRSFLQPLNYLQRGVSYPAVRDVDVRSQPFPLAPMDQQERIVAKIEELFTQLDAGTSALKRIQAGLKRYKASVLKAACEGRLVPQDPSEEPAEILIQGLRKQPINRNDQFPLPSGWIWVSVDDIVSVGTGATPLRSEKKYWDGGAVPWITSGALNQPEIHSSEEFITEKALRETNAKVFPPGTLLVAMYGEGRTRGKVSELLISAATNQACAALVFTDSTQEFRPFLKLYFQKNYLDIRRMSSGGVQPNLNLSIIKNTKIPIPPLREQQRIVEDVDRRFSLTENSEKAVASGLARSIVMKQSILKLAFTGALVDSRLKEIMYEQ